MSRPEKTRNYDPAKRRWVRSLPCKAQGRHRCVFAVQVCHEEHAGGTPDDDYIYPGCAQLHGEDHASRERLEARYGERVRDWCVEIHREWLRMTRFEAE